MAPIGGVVEQRVDRVVDPAHEERGHRRHPGGVATVIDVRLETVQVGGHHLAVPFEREDQGDVDRVAARGHFLDRGHAGIGGRDLDHEIGARDRLVEVRRLLDRGRGVAGQARVDLDRDEAVAALRPVPDRSENVAGVGDVTHCQFQEDASRVRIAGADLLVVGVPVRQRLLENARIRRDADHGVLGHGLRESTGFDQIARQVVDPDALAECGQLMQARAHPDSKPRSR